MILFKLKFFYTVSMQIVLHTPMQGMTQDPRDPQKHSRLAQESDLVNAQQHPDPHDIGTILT